MFEQAAKRHVSARLLQKVKDFRSDERGAIAIFVLMIFVMMLLVGGIAVDVMRSEMRRVAYQQTFDRATLAASNIALPPSQTPTSVGQSWYASAGLGDEFTVDFDTPIITGEATTSSRKTQMTGKVRSYNHFMHMMDIPYFEIPVKSSAQQGVSKIEVIMVLDVTGSMAEASGSTTKIAALREAATNFVNILKFNRDGGGNYTIPKDPNNLISIGMVPYSSNVNIPVTLRNQYTYTNIANWFGQTPGVPNINCFEIPVSTFSSTALSQSLSIPMAAVADTWRPNTAPNPTTATNTRGNVIELSRVTPPTAPNMNSSDVICNHGNNPSTATDETTGNMALLPTTVPATLTNQIALLQPRGRTSIAVGMRWGTALLDDAARPIYSVLRSGEAAMAGRPANNTDDETRKIIVLMTDGDHVTSRHVRDAYKTGPSPIWRGADGNFAIRYTAGGPALTDGQKPFLQPGHTCSGWPIAASREFFVPHLKPNSVRRRSGAEAEGAGSGTSVTGGCAPLSWVAGPTPSWSGSGTVRQLDWSEVWRHVRIDWMVQQLYMRSNVAGTSNYTTVFDHFVDNYLVSDSNMDSLLNTNCTAAKNAGFEVFGIVLGDAVIEDPVRNCSSPGTGYYYKVTTAAALNSAFEQIAVLISELRLTE